MRFKFVLWRGMLHRKRNYSHSILCCILWQPSASPFAPALATAALAAAHAAAALSAALSAAAVAAALAAAALAAALAAAALATQLQRL